MCIIVELFVISEKQGCPDSKNLNALRFKVSELFQAKKNTSIICTLYLFYLMKFYSITQQPVAFDN